MGFREQGTGNREQGTGNREQGIAIRCIKIGNQRQRRLYIITARNAIKVSHSNEIQIIFFLFPTPYSLLPTPYSLKPVME
ncbi:MULTISPECIES: hypothetical protein [unclassified Moorena]|uniref:hypothetical protein n=1 Tax=unclassified Moorena TaxID=2683338 RepID=UPI0013B6B76F|nr:MULTISPECIES: hypothetical protein [unclassified Moorena]NER90307.1 hypothetical protein [Moorena sp. SIO3A2]NET64003.1 hypothetical protein [Moorena sp. SIO1G6]